MTNNKKSIGIKLLMVISLLCFLLGSMFLALPNKEKGVYAATEHDHSGWTVLTNDVDNLSNKNYYLQDDVKLKTNLTISGTVNLCLNGYVLMGKSGSSVITVGTGATLNIYDCGTTEHYFSKNTENSVTNGYVGTWNLSETETENKVVGGVITGGRNGNVVTSSTAGEKTQLGGAIHIKGGTCNLYGGNIVGNSCYVEYTGTSNRTTKKDYCSGGGVYVTNGSFTMYNGSIIGNSCAVISTNGKSLHTDSQASGGGILVSQNGRANVYGGVISDNIVSHYAGGVYASQGPLTVGGTTVIRNNYSDFSSYSGDTENNVMTGNADAKYLLFGESENSPKNGMNVGFRRANIDTPITDTGVPDYSAYLHSDNAGLYVVYDSEQQQIKLGDKTTGNKKSITVTPSSNGVVYANPQAATADENVTLTAVANEGYTLESIEAIYNDGSQQTLNLTSGANNTYTFAMPNFDVTVNAVFEAKEEPVAQIGDTKYTTLADAIDAVTNNGTITLLDDNEEEIVISKAISFTIDANSFDFDKANITACEGYELSSTTSGQETTFKIGAGIKIDDNVPTGAIIIEQTSALIGETVTVTFNNASAGVIYLSGTLSIKYNDGTSDKTASYSANAGIFTFTMPAYPVTISAEFVQKHVNEIKNLTLDGWTYGETPNTPTASATVETPTYTYSTEEDGTYTNEVPTNAGTYWVKAEVAECYDYKGAVAKLQFTIAKATATNNTENVYIEYDGDDHCNQTEIDSNILIVGVDSNPITPIEKKYSFDGLTYVFGTELNWNDVALKNADDSTKIYYQFEYQNYETVNGSFVLTMESKCLITFDVEPIPDQAYTGKEIIPNIIVKDGDTVLVKDTDYSVTGKDNVELGYAVLTITLKGNYLGTSTVSFEIVKAKVDLPTANTGLVYSGMEQTGVTLPDNAVFTITGNTGKNAGSYTAKLSLIDKDNYEWNLATPTVEDQEIQWSIGKKNLTITANKITIHYNDEPTDAGVTCTGFVNDETLEDLDGKLVFDFDGYKKGTDAGIKQFKLTPSGLTSDNYNITYELSRFTVDPIDIATLELEAVYSNKVYNGKKQYFQLEKLMYGDVEFICSYDPNNASGTEVGTYTETVKVVGALIYIGGTPANSPNYTGFYEWSFKITPATITVTANDKEITYGEDAPTFDVKYEGFVNNEDISVLSGELTSLSCSYTKGSNAGEYAITPSGTFTADNYVVEYVAGTLNVKPIEVNVPDLDTTIFIYNGLPQTYNLATSELYTVSENITQTNAGTYTITISLKDKTNHCWFGGFTDDLEYEFNIAPAQLLITAESETITFNDNPSTYTVSVEDFVNGEDFDTYGVDIGSYISCEYTKGSDVGYYDIILADDEDNSLATALSNYDLILWSGCLTVEQKDIEGATVEYEESKVYNGEEQTFNIESVTIDDVDVTYDVYYNTATDYSEFGYTLTITGNGNFTGSITRDFEIVKAQVEKPQEVTTVFTYTGEEQTYNLTESDLYEITNNVQTYVGTYEVKVALFDVDNFEWTDETTDDLTFTFVIHKAQVEKPQEVTTVFTYTGEEQTYNLTESDFYEITNNVQTDAGTYEVKVALFDVDNFEWADETTDDLTFTFVIGQADNEITVSINDWIHGKTPSTPNATATYGQDTIVYAYSTEENGLYTSIVPTTAGTYYVRAKVSETPNYKGAEAKKSFVIKLNAQDIKPQDETGNEIENPEVSIIDTENGFDPNAKLVVKVVELKKAEDTEATIQALDNANKVSKGEMIYGIYDAKLLVDGIEVQPNGNITIKMLVPTELKNKEFKLYHIHNNNGTNEVYEIEYTEIDEDGYITFVTDKLSQFAFVAEKPANVIVWIIIGLILLLLIAYLLGYFFLYREGKLDDKKIKVIYKFLPRGNKNLKKEN